MRAIVLTPLNPDCEKLWRSFIMSMEGHEVEVMNYWGVPGFNLVDTIETKRPDVVIYIGAMGSHNDVPIPSTDEFCRAGRLTKIVHLCSDSADYPWWPMLEEYNNAKAFALQIGIDGCYDTPMAKFGQISLTPIHPKLFPDVGWNERPYVCGFAGGGGARTPILNYFKTRDGFRWINESGFVPYDMMCGFYTACQMVWNDPQTGTGMHRQVKGRFIEAALAGAIPIDAHDSPAKGWFEPGVDYYQWSGVSDIDGIITRNKVDRSKNEEMAARLKAKVRAEHAAPVFWNKIFKQIGL